MTVRPLTRTEALDLGPRGLVARLVSDGPWGTERSAGVLALAGELVEVPCWPRILAATALTYVTIGPAFIVDAWLAEFVAPHLPEPHRNPSAVTVAVAAAAYDLVGTGFLPGQTRGDRLLDPLASTNLLQLEG